MTTDAPTPATQPPSMRRRRTAFGRWWVNLRVLYKGLLVIALPIAGIVATVVLRLPFTQQQQETTVLLNRSEEAGDRGQELLVRLLDAETRSNGYALTRDDTFASAFDRARHSVPQALEALGSAVGDGDERRLYEQASEHARRRVELAAEVVALTRAGRRPGDPDLIERLGAGKQEMDRFRTALGTLLQAQRITVERSQAELQVIRRRMAPIVLLTFFGGFVGMAAAMWLFGTGVSHRMRGLERNAERLANGERLRYEPSRGRDEIGSLDRALRKAAVTIRARDLELRSVNTSLEQSLHEQQLLNRELEAFSYSVSHDLRAPLRSIDGFAQALREDWGDRLDETGQDHLSRVRNAAQRMGRLIDDLLKLARLTRSQIQRIDVDLSQLARDVIGDLTERNPTRQVTWDIEEGLHAVCDPTLARVLLENLLGNAWKFTSKTPAARIEFAALPDSHPTTFVVRDNGAGFDMKYVDKLFAPFQRLHGEREFPGTGIGLATVQRIVHKHGGEVRTRAETGQGAAFYFTFEPSDGVVAA